MNVNMVQGGERRSCMRAREQGRGGRRARHHECKCKHDTRGEREGGEGMRGPQMQM